MEFTRCFRCMEVAERYPCPHCGYDPGKDKIADYVLPPQTILNGKYVVGTPLGQGGFGITYVGWDLALDCKVAIKEYYPAGQVVRDGAVSSQLRWFNTVQSEAAQNTGKEMFLKEARKMTRVRNIPRVVHVHDLFQENDTAYIVMDFVEGQTLKSYLTQHGVLSWEEAKSIFFPAIGAMEQVHQAGLVHRDLSPDNLMLLPDGSVQILDLGAAKDLNLNSGASSMQVAKSGFSPLEQYTQRGGSGPWTDVYAMAATMYYSLCGVLPPPVMDRMEEDLIRWDLEPLQALPTPALEALQKALTLSPKSRTQSMVEFLGGLNGQITASVSQPEPMPKTEPIQEKQPPVQETAKKKPLFPAIIAVVLVVALVAGWVLWPKNKTAEPQLESVGATEAPVAEETFLPSETTAFSETLPLEPVTDDSDVPYEAFTLTVWGAAEDQMDENSFLQVATAKFAEAHPEWDITWVFEVCAEGDAGTNVTKDPAAAADVYAFANDQLGTLLQANAIARLGGDVLAQVEADNSETMIASVTSGEGVYGVPFTGNTWFMYYDSSVYTEEDIKSLDTMMEKGTVAFPVTNTWYLPAFYYAVGGTMFGDGTDGTAGVQFGGENGAKATTYVADALASGKLINDDQGAGLDGMRNGTVNAIFSGTWDAAAVKEILGDNYAAAQLPSITVDGAECQLYSFSGSKAYAANPNSEHLKAATALAAWLGSAEMQALHYEIRDGGVIPCSISLMASGACDGDFAAIAQFSTLAYTSKLQPSLPEMGYYWMNAESMGKCLVKGEITASNATGMTKKWNDSLNGLS